MQEFFQAARPRSHGPAGPLGPLTISVSQLVSSPSIITPTAVSAAFELLKGDAAFAAAGGSSKQRASGGGDGALAATEAAAARVRGADAASAAFGAVAEDAGAPLGVRAAAAARAAPAGIQAAVVQGDPMLSPSPPHMGAFVIPPSPVVGFHSSQLPIRGGLGQMGGPAAARQLQLPSITGAHPSAATGAATAAAVVAPGTAAPGGVGLGGAGVAGLGGGLRQGTGMPLVPTLSSSVDDDVLMAALELLAPPHAAARGGASGAAAATGGGSEPGARGGSDEGEGGGAGRGSEGPGVGAMVRSLSDVQLQDAAMQQEVPQKGGK